MATWQQGINSGGFLAGIGGQNSNAPKASDVSEALAYIRQNNEMERSGRNNIGLQALQGLGSVAQTYQAAKHRKRMLHSKKNMRQPSSQVIDSRCEI